MNPHPAFSPAKLKAARGSRSQTEVAAAAGLTQPTYSLIESGARPNPGISTIARIAAALGLRVDDLLD